MNVQQLSERMGNIDDRLIRQAEEHDEYRRSDRRRGFRRGISVAVVAALMMVSFTVGALASVSELETLALEEIGLTLIIPEEWKGKYALEKGEGQNEYYIYHPGIREAMGEEGGMLFYIRLREEQLTKEQVEAGGEWDFAKCEYIMTTKDGTYLLYYASDVQCTPETLEEYQTMEGQIEQIRFVIEDPLGD